MTSVVVIGGCPGAGKTSVAHCLADKHRQGVHVESDIFFRAVRHLIDPSMPASQRQNEMIVQAYCEACRVYDEHGMQVYLEGVIGPRWLPALKNHLGSFHYILLHLPYEAARERVLKRRGQASARISQVDRMWPKFEVEIANYQSHVIEVLNLSTEEVSEVIQQRVEQQYCLVSKGRA